MSKQAQLSNYYRKVKSYITLPSKTSYYDPSILDFTASGEVGIRAMTGDDEISLKNPDSLLNGECLRGVLLSCVDGLKKPECLLTNDVDVIFAAIRHVTFKDGMTLECKCPSCSKKENYVIDYPQLLENIDFLDEKYEVVLSNGLTIRVKPHTLSDQIDALRVAFKQEKLRKMNNNDKTTEEERIKLISDTIKAMTALNYNMLSNSIMELYDVENNVLIKNTKETRKDVETLLHNVEKSDFDMICDKVNDINKIGLRKEITLQCKECKHSWEANLDVNPLNFSMAS
jgi:hypothetical protein